MRLCQDLSVAGKMRGMEKGSGTRSSLLFEVGRLLDEVEELPQILLMENVPQVISKKNLPAFEKWKGSLEWKGYKNYIQILNAKDYGMPQSRKRCFMVSVLGDKNYQFPKPIPLEKGMSAYLEDRVDEKHYLKSEKSKDLINKLVIGGKLEDEPKRTAIFTNMATENKDYVPDMKYSDVGVTLLARDYKGWANIPANGVVEKWKLM